MPLIVTGHGAQFDFTLKVGSKRFQGSRILFCCIYIFAFLMSMVLTVCLVIAGFKAEVRFIED